MRYMLLIYTNEEGRDRMSPQQVEAVKNGHRAVMAETAKLGILLGADPLRPTSSATTVRMKDGRMLTTDGPFAETKEQLAGYYLLECKDLDEALSWAAKIPTECGGASGCVEVRPLHELTERQDVAAEWQRRVPVGDPAASPETRSLEAATGNVRER